MDIQQSTNTADSGQYGPVRMEPDNTQDILNPDNMEGLAEELGELDVSGLDPKEFAELVAEVTAAYLPDDADADLYKKRYVGMVAPLLKIGGFEKITAEMNLNGLVEKYPFIGMAICGGAMAAGVYFCWPKPPPPPPPKKEDEIEWEGQE